MGSNLFSSRLKRLLPLLLDMTALKAMASWPVFSITSYTMATDLFRQGIRPRTVIDVGANQGQFSVAALNTFDDITLHAFEPLQTCAARLRANTSAFGRVFIHPVALAAETGHADFYVSTNRLSSSLLRMTGKQCEAYAGVAEKRRITVPVSTLDAFFAGASPTGPVLVKIDVQGAEKQVLEGGRATLQRVDYVVVETSFTSLYHGEPLFLEMLDVMRSLGFAFVRPVDFLKSPGSGEILQADILFRRNR